MIRRVNLAVLSVTLVGCSLPPARLPLPAPLAPIYGATPVAGNGAGLGATLADALRGQELFRTEVRGIDLVAGVGQRFGLGFGNLATRDELNNNTYRVDVSLVRAKVLVSRPFGRKSAFGVHALTAWGDRLDTTVQDERIHVYDVALPFEFLLSNSDRRTRASIYFAPRGMVDRYQDQLVAGQSMTSVVGGMTGGFHVGFSVMELFGEATVAYVPSNTYQGNQFGNRVTIIPAIGVMARFGPAFHWLPRD